MGEWVKKDGIINKKTNKLLFLFYFEETQNPSILNRTAQSREYDDIAN